MAIWHGHTWGDVTKLQGETLQTALKCGQTPAGLEVTVFPVSPPQGRILSNFPFILWREEWVTQIEQEQRQAQHAGGLFVTRRQMRGKQNNCNLFSCLEEEEEVAGCGVFPGFQRDAIRTDQNQYCTSLATFGARNNVPLCCYGNSGFVVFSLPLTWADVSKYIVATHVQPLKLRASSNLLTLIRCEQHANNKASANTAGNKQTYRYTKLTSPGSQKPCSK